MYEIELKAHVADEEAVRQALSSFAQPLEVIDKDDTYYRLDMGGKTAPDGRPYLTCRIREEVVTECAASGGVYGSIVPCTPPANHRSAHGTDSTDNKSVLFTYKRKRLVQNGEGAAIEVNDENECTIGSKGALEAMLLDAGFTVSHRKHKRAEGYMAQTPCGEAHIELCAVPPLGNFLEIEVISEKHDDETVTQAHQAIKDIFTRCGIPLDAIEERYYTQMLEGFQR